MLKWLGKMVAEKIVGMLVVLLTIAAIVLVWNYRHHLPSPSEVGRFVGLTILWVALATLLPWATFFLVAWIERAESNIPAIGLLVFWATIDALMAWWLSGGGVPSVPQGVAVGLAFCVGGLYNLIAANQIANRLSRH